MVSTAGKIWIVAITTLLLYGNVPVWGQGVPTWHLQTGEGTPVSWPDVHPWPLDSLEHAALHALHTVQSRGYYLARIDSHHVEKAQHLTLFVTLGPRVTIGYIHIKGASAIDSLDLNNQLYTRPGRPLDPLQLEADVKNLLEYYLRSGFLLARIHVSDISPINTENPQAGITLVVEEGPVSILHSVELEGTVRTRPRHIARIAALRPGEHLTGYNPESIRQRLSETALFRSVDLPEIYLNQDSLIIVRIPVVEEPPGAFDLILGYQPAPSRQRGGRLVGSGHLALRNLFGHGRLLSFEIQRPPGRVSRLNLQLSDPRIMGLPLSLQAHFEGLQQDSTYGKRIYGLQAGYQFRSGLQIFALMNREVVRPGLSGLDIIDTAQRVPLASGFFAGFGIHFRRLDHHTNPRRGFVVETRVEQGRKNRQLKRVRVAADTTDELSRLRQDRLHATLRLYIPTWSRQVLVFGGDMSLLRSNEYDESDLFRLGGATTLRGYDEERFRAPFISRLFTEYRYQIDRSSYGLLFFDLGYLDYNAAGGFYPGFGAGFQLETDVGLILLSLAANTENPALLRAHVGLSVGL